MDYIFDSFKKLSSNEQENILHECVEYGMHDLDNQLFLNILDDKTSSNLSKWYAIKAIGEKHIDKGIQKLIDIIKVPDVSFENTSLHLIAAYSLGKFGEQSLDNLVCLLNADYPLYTQKAVADTLGEIKSSKAIPALIFAIQYLDDSVALWAGLSISKIGSGAEDLIGIYSSLSETKRYIILDALMRFCNALSVEFIIQQLKANQDMLNSFSSDRSIAFKCFLNYLHSINHSDYSFFKEYAGE